VEKGGSVLPKFHTRLGEKGSTGGRVKFACYFGTEYNRKEFNPQERKTLEKRTSSEKPLKKKGSPLGRAKILASRPRGGGKGKRVPLRFGKGVSGRRGRKPSLHVLTREPPQPNSTGGKAHATVLPKRRTGRRVYPSYIQQILKDRLSAFFLRALERGDKENTITRKRKKLNSTGRPVF